MKRRWKDVSLLRHFLRLMPGSDSRVQCLSDRASMKNSVDSGQRRINKDPIFVFQMGRVGSISIRNSILRAYQGLNTPISVYHTHWQANFEELESSAKRDHAEPGQLLSALQEAKEVRRQLVDNPQVHCKLISIVRDPVARNISTFFYALPEFITDWEAKVRSNTLTLQLLHNEFLVPRAFHLTPEKWFDEQLKPAFGIDVYASEFPRENGYKVYASSKADLLVLRFEDFKKLAPFVFREFLGLQDFELLTTNTGEERNTGGLYRMFKTQPIQNDYLERMYSTQYAHHFYSQKELHEFQKHWGAVTFPPV